MSVALQISSLAALERLIGGDTQLEIEIRNSVVQNFTNKHLKGLFNGAFAARCEEVKKSLQREAEKAMVEQFGTLRPDSSGWGSPKLVINEETRKALHDAATAEVSKVRAEFVKTVEDAIERMLSTRFTEERIERLVAERFAAGVETIIKNKVDARLQALKDAI